MDEPPRRQDKTALLVLGGAGLLVVALGAYLFFAIRSQPESGPQARPGDSLVQRARDAVQKQISELKQEPKAKPAPPAAGPRPQPQPPKTQQQSPKTPPQKAQPETAQKPQTYLPQGRSWRYNVKVEPEVWKDVTLTYRHAQDADGPAVSTEFRHSGGQSAFKLGTFARNHPSHTNTRFPGFFMYAAYLDQPLRAGQKVAFGWPWQGKSAGEKRFEGAVTGFEEVTVPSGKYLCARVEGSLTYLEGGQVRARAHEVFWYTPEVGQVVKIERQGVVPDEATRRITAELAAFR